MNVKTLIPFVVAIGLGVAAVTVGRNLLKKQGGAGAGTDYARVVVAKAALVPGQQLKESDLSTSEMPKSSVPEGAVYKAQDIIGRAVAIPVAKGQTIVESAVAPKDAGFGLTAIVPKGMRAVTIEVNEYSGMTTLLQPGCRVDVLVTLVDEATRRTIARTIVENVRVLSLGSGQPGSKAMSDNVNANIPKSVTLLVTTKEAEAIELATSKGKPRLVMRGGKDEMPVVTLGVSIGELLGEGIQQRAQAFQQGGMSLIQLLRGTGGAPSTQPTTQPLMMAAAPPASIIPVRRTVEMIRGSNESVKHFERVPTVPQTVMYDDRELTPNDR